MKSQENNQISQSSRVWHIAAVLEIIHDLILWRTKIDSEILWIKKNIKRISNQMQVISPDSILWHGGKKPIKEIWAWNYDDATELIKTLFSPGAKDKI